MADDTVPLQAGPVTVSTTTDSREPDGYDVFITDLKHRVRSTQFRMVRAANTELLRLFWNVGNEILTRQRDQGWGAKVVDRISADLRREFPGQRGWSRRNLLYMRKVAEVWPTESEFVHQPGAQLPWRHVRTPCWSWAVTWRSSVGSIGSKSAATSSSSICSSFT
ncbi:DUF1016 N-terminal domain-containing protein [Promicromonospora sp. NPDC052451]|uniref:DUF1016 N-terminal domain-containing protein n=1 Tax=Promicromonospora sp. NPDC052451 TaxID=3364407 RepID=UPI0037C8955C